MKSRLLELSLSLEGKQRLTIELDEDARKTFDRLKDKTVDVTIKQWREKRSLDANAYAWALIDKIAAKRRMSKVEVYRNAIRDIGGVSYMVSIQKNLAEVLRRDWTAKGIGWQVEEIETPTPGWQNMILYRGSSDYNTAEMAALIDSLVQDAQSIGIETRPQEEIDSLLREVEERCSTT